MAWISRRGILQSGGALLLATSWDAVGSTTAPTDDIARLDRNENPLGPSPRAKASLVGLGNQAWRYPYEEIAALRALIAQQAGVPAECIYVSEGSAEVLKLAAMIYGVPGRQIITSRPTFPMLPQFAERLGAAVSWVEVDQSFAHDFAAMQARITPETSLIYICNPNNPTGSLADPMQLRAFIDAVSERALVVVDEAYIDFASEPGRTTVVDCVKAGRNVLITRSFSKLYGLAGLRIGYGIANVDVIRRLESLRMSFPNVAGVTAARASLGDSGFIADVRRRTAESREITIRLFDDLRLPRASSHANFVMFKPCALGPGFVEFARQRRVMVAAVMDPFSSWVRVSMGHPRDMQAFARVLHAFVEQA